MYFKRLSITIVTTDTTILEQVTLVQPDMTMIVNQRLPSLFQNWFDCVIDFLVISQSQSQDFDTFFFQIFWNFILVVFNVIFPKKLQISLKKFFNIFFHEKSYWYLWLAIKGTRTVRECRPHVHCADRTPHSKLKEVRTRTVLFTLIEKKNLNWKFFFIIFF